MRCSDGRYYVVKFQNNPQDRRVLVNDLLGTLLTRLLGLPSATPAVVNVSYELIRLTHELRIEHPSSLRGYFQSGLQFGSHYIGNPRRCVALDFLPDHLLCEVENLSDFAGMLVFDKWTCNTDQRQVVFQRGRLKYKAVMIDQGFCFNSGGWSFPDAPLRGSYGRTCVYDRIRRMNDFEPWLSRLENRIDEQAIWGCAAKIPHEWYDSDTDALKRLVATLNTRRGSVRELLWWTQHSPKNFLRNWISGEPFAAAAK
jgi:hypothetical protein